MFYVVNNLEYNYYICNLNSRSYGKSIPDIGSRQHVGFSHN